MSDARQEGADFHRWAQVVRRRKWLLLTIVVLIPAAVYGVSRALPKTYESSTTLFVQPTGSGSTVFSTVRTSSANAGETATLAQTTLVARRAAHILGQPPQRGRALLSQIQTGPVESSESSGNFLKVSAQASDPKRAAEVANAFATAIAQVRTGNAIGSIERTIDTLKSAQRSLERQGNKENQTTEEELASQLQQLRGLKASQAGTTAVVEPAVPATAPVSPKPLRNTLLALLVAVLVAAGLVPLLDRLDRRLRDPDELEELLEPPLLVTIPDIAFPGHLPDWHVREAFQTLRAGLTYFNIDRPVSSLVIASPAQLDGKTTVAVNLAVAYALDGSDVILVDADLRHPQVANRLGQEDVVVGLDSVLVGAKTLKEALIEVDAGGGRLRVLPGATPPPNPAALLGSQRMRSLLAELTEQADIVLIDTPALLAVSDSMPLLNQAAGVVLVARLNQTTKETLGRASQVIAAAGGSVLGTVATGARGAGTYGYYGYHDYSAEGDGQERAAPSANGAGGGQVPDPRPEGGPPVTSVSGQSEAP